MNRVAASVVSLCGMGAIHGAPMLPIAPAPDGTGPERGLGVKPKVRGGGSSFDSRTSSPRWKGRRKLTRSNR